MLFIFALCGVIHLPYSFNEYEYNPRDTSCDTSPDSISFSSRCILQVDIEKNWKGYQYYANRLRKVIMNNWQLFCMTWACVEPI